MTIIDSHLHVWSDDELRYPWRALPNFGLPTRIKGSVELLLQLQTKSGVQKSVLVQPGNYGYDHSYMFDCCRRYPDRFVAVGLIDHQHKNAAQILMRMVIEDGLGGLRLRPLWTPEDWRWLTDPSAYKLWEMAGELKIPISFLIYPNQISALEEMVRLFPHVKVIVDHLGCQYAEEAPSYESVSSLLKLADYPNTFVKVSALSAASRQSYPYKDVIGLVRRIYNCFGAHRLMWGTDFPYVQLKEGYLKARNLVDLFDFLSVEDKEWLLGRTVMGLYGFAPKRCT